MQYRAGSTKRLIGIIHDYRPYSDDKMHARSIAVLLITQQPLGGRPNSAASVRRNGYDVEPGAANAHRNPWQVG